MKYIYEYDEFLNEFLGFGDSRKEKEQKAKTKAWWNNLRSNLDRLKMAGNRMKGDTFALAELRAKLKDADLSKQDDQLGDVV